MNYYLIDIYGVNALYRVYHYGAVVEYWSPGVKKWTRSILLPTPESVSKMEKREVTHAGAAKLVKEL